MKAPSKTSQREAILADLRAGRVLDPLGALRDYRCFRLTSRISELREQGWPIEVRLVNEGGKRHAEYRLAQLDHPGKV